MLAFCGRTEALRRLLKARLPKLHRDAKEFWLGTSERAAGDPIAARTRLEALRASTESALIRAEITQRLNSRALLTGPLLTPPNEATVQRFERNVDAPRGIVLRATARRYLARRPDVHHSQRADVPRRNPARRLDQSRHACIGSARSSRTRCSQVANTGGSSARSFSTTARCICCSICYALYILGPPLESTIGSARFAISYLLAGLGSSAGVVLLWRFNWTRSRFPRRRVRRR